MIYYIENENLRVGISDLGAELMSIVKKADNCEYLWQGNPEYWAGRACNLFPICGRLTEGKYTYDGKTYEMQLHGFARKSTFKVTGKDDASISFTLTSNADTLAIYPFEFEFTVSYALDGDTVSMGFNVANHGQSKMYFALGGHPGFNVPLCEGESFEDYYIEFGSECAPKSLVLSETCYYLNKMTPFALDNGRSFNLRHSLFDNDAIFLHGMAKDVTLKSRKSDKQVHVSYPDMKYLGFWHKPKSDAPYVCIEPWSSVPADHDVIDDLRTKREMMTLEPGGSYKTSIGITIK